MSPIEVKFNQRFAKWSIALPKDAVTQRTRGRIDNSGWTIWFLFGIDESGEYLDYYSSHRMVDDEHVRIRTDGSEETLPTISSMREGSKDPDVDARLDNEFVAENQRVSKILKAKGFGIDGDESLNVQINRALASGELK